VDQPILFNHIHHKEVAHLNCTFCHRFVERYRVAGIPKYRCQVKEIKIKVILYNLSSAMNYSLFWLLRRDSTEPNYHSFMIN
jgi:hypothetical protein